MEQVFNTELILNYMKEHKLTKTAFCKLCGFGTATLNKILNHQLSMRINVLTKLARAMNVEIKDVLYRKNKA